MMVANHGKTEEATECNMLCSNQVTSDTIFSTLCNMMRQKVIQCSNGEYERGMELGHGDAPEDGKTNAPRQKGDGLCSKLCRNDMINSILFSTLRDKSNKAVIQEPQQDQTD